MRIKERAANRPPTFKTVTMLSLCHIVNDSYMNTFPPLLPFLIPVLGLNVASIGWLMTCFSVTSSISQLAIGYLTDRIGGRAFIVLGPLVAAVFMSSIGFIDNYFLLLLVVCLAGLGVASFHPPASAIAGSVSEHKSGRAMSLFTLGGNIGWALMPLIAVPLVSAWGLSATSLLVIPGIIVAVLLFLKVPEINPERLDRDSGFLTAVREKPGQFISLLGMVSFRSLAVFGLIAFLPKYLADMGFSPIHSGIVLSALSFAGVFGGLLGGFLSDYWSRKPIIIGSLLITAPLLYAMFILDSSYLIIFIALAGASLLASFSVGVVIAQQIFPRSKAMASSLALGFGLGLGGLGVGVIGNLATVIGLKSALLLLSGFPLISALFALGLPGQETNKDSSLEAQETLSYQSASASDVSKDMV